MKKNFTVWLIALLGLMGMSAATVQAQTTGGSLAWKYDAATKTLTVSGQGDMPNYDWKHPAPWRDHNREMLMLVVEEGITGIGDNAFRDAGSLISASLPKTLTRIGFASFSFCSSLPMVTIPAGVTKIDDWAFQYCYGLAIVSLPAGLQEIGFGAFIWCEKLSAVTIPAGVKKIGSAAFSACSNLQSITVADGNANYIVVDGVLFNKEKTTLVQYPAGRVATSYVIPKEVTSIEHQAFNNSDNLTAVTLPAGVTSIGVWAFANCSKLTSITIPATVKTIGDGTFTTCQELAEIKVEAANTAYTSADGVLFDKAKKTLIKYPEGRNATAYAIPAGVTNIESEAFGGTKKLTSVTIPASVKKIGYNAFSASGLTSAVIPAGVDTISSGLFSWCEKLASVTLPASVKTIGYSAFYGCKSLKSLTVGMKTPSGLNENDDVFGQVPVANVTLTVPKGSKAAYAATPVWKEFKQIAESTVSNVLLPEARIYTAEGRLYLTLSRAETVHIYNVSGALVRSFTAPAGETSVMLPQGVYVVRAGSKTEKVAVQ